MNNNTFFDIHMHALNLSHPYLLAFITRLKIHHILILNSLLGPIASLLIGQNFNKLKNLLAVMENDIGSLFFIIEDYLGRDGGSPLVSDGKLHIGGNVYTKIVLTPLMMDFGYKDIKDNPDTYYNELTSKPIVEQVTDVFNGIRKYRTARPNGILEIYPFLGINTKNYDMERIEKMLHKYFGDYTCSREYLNRNMGEFDGNIDNLGSNSFAGIKVYPPLGFNPWPKNAEELEKVKYLYNYCCEKGIPITSHGGSSGFVAVKDKDELREYTSTLRWKEVMTAYPELKLNLAHFPLREKSWFIFPRRKRLRETLELISNYENIYIDFSCRAVDDGYYMSLKKLVDSLSDEARRKLKNRILFGSDFSVNLMAIESYNGYLRIFSGTDHLTQDEKSAFCSTNPERFLFG